MTKERWQQLNLIEQLANIGSEVQRAGHWQSKNETASQNLAIARTLELIDLTLTDQRWSDHRLKELNRLREVFCDSFADKRNYEVSPDSLNDYFIDFALLARK
ncbi:MAG: hypothetical protein V1692_01480 [bacterium]